MPSLNRPLLNNKSFKDLSDRAAANLQNRLRQHASYTNEEIAEISKKNGRLFPRDFQLSTDGTNRFRALCQLSNIQLRPSRQITSHRRYVGWLVVLVKKLTWPLVQFHLKEPFAGIQEFSSWAVTTMAKQHSELAALRQEGEKPSQV